MRLDHLLSKREEVGGALLFSCQGVHAVEYGRTKATKELPVAMRLRDTPVLIPNTKVKTQAADGTMLETVWESRWLPDFWGHSSVGRAPALQAGGREFESLYLHLR